MQIIVLAIVAAIGAYSYFAYSRKMFPFTDSNVSQIKCMFKSGKAVKANGRFQKCVDKDGKDIDVSYSSPSGVVLPPNALPDGTDLTNISDPSGGTGAVSLDNPKLAEYQPKPDPTIEQNFQKELYKQIFLPYDQYPYLYDQNYLQAQTLANPDGTPADRANNPFNTVFGFRPPIQGGDVPPNAKDFNQYFDQIYNAYGLFPPGGDANTMLDDSYFQQAGDVPLGSGSGSGSIPPNCYNVSGKIYCPTNSTTASDCIMIGGVRYCALSATPTTGGGTTGGSTGGVTGTILPNGNIIYRDSSGNIVYGSATGGTLPSGSTNTGAGGASGGGGGSAGGGGTGTGSETGTDSGDSGDSNDFSQISDQFFNDSGDFIGNPSGNATDVSDTGDSLSSNNSKCSQSRCKSKYHGSCHTECQHSSSSACKDCKATCCSSANMARTFALATLLSPSETKNAYQYAAQKAKEHRLLMEAEIEHRKLERQAFNRNMHELNRRRNIGGGNGRLPSTASKSFLAMGLSIA